MVADVERDDRGVPRFKPGTDAEIARVGGRWDRRSKRWSPRVAGHLLEIRFHRGQEAAARWFVDWLGRWVRNDWRDYKRAWSVLLIGGRGSGKTHVVCAAMVIFAIVSPKSLQWGVSPTLETGDELDENFRQMIPRGWYTRRQAKTGRATTFRFANGSRILLKSGVKPQRLKAGRQDIVFLNEAQELSKVAYVKVRARIGDRGGIVIMAANPPDTPLGRWVEEHFTGVRAGRIDGEAFELDPRDNPFMNYDALASMSTEVDEKTFQRDVLGLFPPIGDIVMHAWDPHESVRVIPDRFVDVTAELTRLKLGHAAGYVPGMDFQLSPHMAATIHKFFRDPDGDPTDIYEWIVDEVAVEDADEHMLLDKLEAIPRWLRGDGAPETRDPGRETGGYRGWREADDDAFSPVHCAVVMDASAWWQDGAHVKNRQSNKIMASRRWSHCFRPRFEKDPRTGEFLRNNPEITERVKLTNGRLKSHSGRRRLFALPHCTDTARAMRMWPNKNGIPDRKSEFAHLCDTVSYPVYRFFGKPKIKGRSEYRGGERFDRAADLRGW